MSEFFVNCQRLAKCSAVLGFLSLAPVDAQADDYAFVTNNGTITITGYTGPGGAVTIPSTISGMPVTSIGVFAFGGTETLRSIIIPDTVSVVGFNAFEKCLNLTNVVIGSGVKTISDFAFYECSSLSGVTIPNSVTKIYPNAFYKCGSLTCVIIPESVTYIGAMAFANCTNLSSVTIPESVIRIGSLAFSRCTSLTSIMIPDSVTGIGGEPFRGCTNLTSIAVDAGNPFYSSRDGVLFDKSARTLVQCPAAKAGGYVIPNTVTNVKAYAFGYCRMLTTITIPNTITSIAEGVFYECDGLTGITVPNSVTNIGQYAFYGCSSVTGVFFTGNAPEYAAPDAFYESTNATVFYLPGTTGWSATFAGRPTAPWLLPHPLILTLGPNFGVSTNAFAFRVSWATNAAVVMEASAAMAGSVWRPLRTNVLLDGWCDFSDTGPANNPARFYRVRSQ